MKRSLALRLALCSNIQTPYYSSSGHLPAKPGAHSCPAVQNTALHIQDIDIDPCICWAKNHEKNNLHTLSTSLERWCRCRLLLQLFLKASGWSSNSSGWIQPNLGPTKVTCCGTRHPWTMLSIQDIQASSRCSTSLRYADKHFGPWHPWIHETIWFDSQISQVITFSSIEVPQVWKKKQGRTGSQTDVH